MTFRSADEVRSGFMQSFPVGAGEFAYELWRSVAHLHLKWKDYRALFGASPERIDLLKETAPAFFGRLDPVMRHDVVLAITRLTDPAARLNASLARMIKVLAPHVDAPTLTGWQARLAELDAAAEPLRAIRNRFLAHEDLATTLNHHSQPLPGFSRADVEGLLQRIRDLFGSIEEKFHGSNTSHQMIISDGGDQLLASLERARAHKACERAEFKQKYGVDLGDE